MTEAQKLVEQIKQTNMAELIKSMDADTRTALVAEMASQDVLTVDADEFTDEVTMVSDVFSRSQGCPDTPYETVVTVTVYR